jgi:hypothetical protein
MYRMLLIGGIFALSGSLLLAQAARQSTRRLSPAVVATAGMTCKVISNTELEVQYPDQSTRRVAIPSTSVVATRRPSEIAVASGVMVRPDTRGFDENGEPYVDEHQPDGSIRRTQRGTITIIKPDGTKQTTPLMGVRSDVQAGTPPELPADPKRGRIWAEQHNAAIRDLISDIVHGDPAEMARFSDAEQRATHGDLFAQIAYRTKVATFLAGGQ